LPAIVTTELAAAGERSASEVSRVEIVTANGRRIIVGTGTDVAVLVRLVRGLEQL
jgi:hypothetical protein